MLAKRLLRVISSDTEVREEWVVGNLHLVQIYFICLIPTQYYLLLGLPPLSHPTGDSVCLQSFYHYPRDLAGTPYHPRFGNPKNLKLGSTS
jgi:hypothetical protein